MDTLEIPVIGEDPKNEEMHRNAFSATSQKRDSVTGVQGFGGYCSSYFLTGAQ
jgi:hypothetical protein